MEHLEVAVLEHSGRRHILQKRDTLPFTAGHATSMCGVDGRFQATVYMKPNFAALTQNRDTICDKCFKHLAQEGLKRYEGPSLFLTHPVKTWFRFIPKGRSRQWLETWAEHIGKIWRFKDTGVIR